MSGAYALVSQLALVSIVSLPFTRGVYEAFWNVPSATCKKLGIDVPLEKFDILHNKAFVGDEMVIFYEKRFGLCPYYNNSDPNQPVNGGLPQNLSLDAHLAEVEKHIKQAIPNRCFRGAAVIDLEEWRPLYKMNWGLQRVYREQSLKLVQEKHPELTPAKAEEQAEKEFNKAAQEFFVKTLETARKLVPYARWGYYDYPYCNVKAGREAGDYSCTKEAQKKNDQLAFIYHASTALFPSIYLKGRTTAEQSSRFIQALLAETRRIATATTRANILVYTKFEYDPYNSNDSFYNESDLCNTIKLPSELGAGGVVIWSASKNIKLRCNGIADYIGQHLGQYLLRTRQQVLDCRKRRCSGNGNCVLSKPVAQCNMDLASLKDYSCICDEGYSGDNCSSS